MKYKPLMLMRAKGISGPFMRKHANATRTLSKSAGWYHGVSNPIDVNALDVEPDPEPDPP